MNNSKIPSLEVRKSYPLIRFLCPIFVREEFKKNLQVFLKELERYREEILINISKTFGKEWKEEDIIIYPIPPEVKIPSISDPLLLKIRSDQFLNLYFLVHELVHRFITKIDLKINKKPGAELEAFVIFVTQKVFSEIFGEKKTLEMREVEKKIVKSRDEKLCEKIIKEKKREFEKLVRLPMKHS